ncbi:hypothetical protein [Kitasatospora sp. NPDC093558]|uniref:hypothetical protein n=1 Tax=Kitasatospora sp. NPDC093558 TaxID=3155201 RepID=UPI00342E1803
MGGHHLTVGVELADETGGVDAAARDIEYLLEELEQLDLPKLGYAPAGAAPKGTRAGDLLSHTSLIVGLAGAPALTALVAVVQSWLSRRGCGTVTVRIGADELQLTAATRAEQRRLVELFVEAHTTAGDDPCPVPGDEDSSMPAGDDRTTPGDDD